MAHNIRDQLLKNAIECFPKSFIRFFYKNADELFDLDKDIEFMETELRQTEPDVTDPHNIKDATRLDSLLKVPLRSSPLNYLMVLVE